MTFWWGDLERSVRIEGPIQRVTDQEADEYFDVRPRGSQIGAWSSHQSEEIPTREALEAVEDTWKEKYADKSVPVPRPPYWGGYRIVPTRIEFWKGRGSRLHDRLVFERTDAESVEAIVHKGSVDQYAMTDVSKWTLKRLQP